MWYIHTVEYYSATKKRSTDTRDNMDELEKCHAQWKKPDTKGHALYESTYIKSPEQENPKRQKIN